MELENMAYEPTVSSDESAPKEKYLTKAKAARYAGVSEHQIRQLMESGGLPGAVRGASTTEGWRVPISALDAALASGKLRRKRVYHKRAPSRLKPVVDGPIPARMTLKEAAERFGIGFSTLQAKAYYGLLPTEKVQVGPNQYKKYVKADDVAKLPINRAKGNLGKPRAVSRSQVERPVVTAVVPQSDLTSELLRAADMVRDGKYRVAKLSFALEFTGGE